MQFISRYNTSFMAFINRKYNKRLRNFDDYSDFILETNTDEYYETLEGDLRAYCDWQNENKMERRAKNESKVKGTVPQRESR